MSGGDQALFDEAWIRQQEGEFAVSDFEQDPRGFWTATLTINGKEIRVDNATGSWSATCDQDRDPAEPQRRQEVLNYHAAALQERIGGGRRGKAEAKPRKSAKERGHALIERDKKPRKYARRQS